MDTEIDLSIADRDVLIAIIASQQAIIERLENGLRVSVGAIADATQRVAGQAQAVMADIVERVPGSPVVHADETGWREDGHNGYVWTFSAPTQRTSPVQARGRLCRRIERHIKSLPRTGYGELFVFVAQPEVPSDNNTAERSLRPVVVSRKISGGTRSNQGTDTKMTLASVFGAWRAQGLYQRLLAAGNCSFPSSLNSYVGG